jgi:hypothetical protein
MQAPLAPPIQHESQADKSAKYLKNQQVITQSETWSAVKAFYGANKTRQRRDRKGLAAASLPLVLRL